MGETWVFSALELTGRSRTHIVDVATPPCSLHHAVVEPFLAMRASANRDGIDLKPVSSFRDFARQVAIWNGKCRGERPLLDRNGAKLDPAGLDEDALVDAVLQWSALPGTSRHHWGTDMDVIDAAALPSGYTAQLSTNEFAVGGVFAELEKWLAAHAAQFGFYRPFGSYLGGVQPEPWHLSYAPVAQQAMAQFSSQMLQQALAEAGLDAIAAVSRRLPEIVQRYVLNIDSPPPLAVTSGPRLA
jgi:LAS superfamily LD-carboxypeptidase LdcB